MKKLMLLAVGLLISITAFSQSLDDVWQCLRQDQAPKAKKFLEAYMANNPNDAQGWLMKGNVYLNLYKMDMDRREKDPGYVLRFPDALEVANEAFVKALQLDPKVQPKTGMVSAQQGQSVMAKVFEGQGLDAEANKDYDNAIKYLNLAANGYVAAGSPDAAVPYFHQGLIYYEKGDVANEKEMMNKVIKINPKDFAGAYTLLYYAYRDEDDTTQCEKILKQGKKSVNPSLLKDLYDIELDYWAYTNNSEQLFALCDSIMAKNPLDSTADVLLAANCANYLTNFNAFDRAESLLTTALAKQPKSYKLNEQLSYCYYQQMIAYDQQVKDLQAKKDWNGVLALQKADSEWSINRKRVIEKAHEWGDKAYQLKDTNYDNLDNNRRLKQLKVLLGIEVPADLNDAINARMHQN